MVKSQYKNEYFNLGFTYITQQSIIKPRCVISAEVLNNEPFKRNKLKRRLEPKRLAQWFPTFSISWTLLMICLKVVGPFNKTSQYCYVPVVSTRK